MVRTSKDTNLLGIIKITPYSFLIDFLHLFYSNTQNFIWSMYTGCSEKKHLFRKSYHLNNRRFLGLLVSRKLIVSLPGIWYMFICILSQYDFLRYVSHSGKTKVGNTKETQGSYSHFMMVFIFAVPYFNFGTI